MQQERQQQEQLGHQQLEQQVRQRLEQQEFQLLEQLGLEQQERQQLVLLELGCWWFQLAYQQVFLLASQLVGNQLQEPNRKQPTFQVTSSFLFFLTVLC